MDALRSFEYVVMLVLMAVLYIIITAIVVGGGGKAAIVLKWIGSMVLFVVLVSIYMKGSL